MKCKRYSLYSSKRGPLPSMQIGSAYLTTMGTSWNMPLVMGKKKKKGRGSSIELFSFLLRQRFLEKPSPPAISLFLLPRDPDQFYYCRIQPYFSISEVSSYQENECWSWNVMPEIMQKWEFSIKSASVSQKVCVNIATLKPTATC